MRVKGRIEFVSLLIQSRETGYGQWRLRVPKFRVDGAKGCGAGLRVQKDVVRGWGARSP